MQHNYTDDIKPESKSFSDCLYSRVRNEVGKDNGVVASDIPEEDKPNLADAVDCCKL